MNKLWCLMACTYKRAYAYTKYTRESELIREYALGYSKTLVRGYYRAMVRGNYKAMSGGILKLWSGGGYSKAMVGLF